MTAMARAMPTRWRWPPLSSCGSRAHGQHSGPPARAAQHALPECPPFAALQHPVHLQRVGDRFVHRHARIERAERILEDDLSLERRAAIPRPQAWVMSAPASRIAPEVGSSNRTTSRPSDDLPQPDSPTTATNFSRPDAEADAVDGLHGPVGANERIVAARREMLREVHNLQDESWILLPPERSTGPSVPATRPMRWPLFQADGATDRATRVEGAARFRP